MHSKINKLKLLVILVLSYLTGFSQDVLMPGQYTSQDTKAIKYYMEGKRYYDNRQDQRAEDLLLRAIDKDKKFMEPHVIVAIIYLEQKRLKESAEHMKRAIEIAPNYYVENYFTLAQTEFELDDFENAKLHYSQFLKFQRINPDTKEEAEFKLKCIDFAANAKKNPKNIQFKNAGPAINSPNSEYFPTMTADENYFLYTRRLPEGGPMYQEDLFLSKADRDGNWTGSRPIMELSSQGNEGAPSISADGNYMFITVSPEMDGRYLGGLAQGYGSCDIFYTQKMNGKWTKPVNLGTEINSSQWESQPSFSSDGRTLYFVRGIIQRNHQVSGIDIYYSVLGPDGRFSAAAKLPNNINTKKDEQSVFIHPDNQTLYFSSEGHVGMGGADIFMSKRKPDGSWGDPVNLGYPINTNKDENSLLVAPSGRLAYFASDREGGFGELDIYQFEVPESMKPEKITYVKGKVFNAKTKEPLEANFELVDLETQKQVARAYSQKNGEFLTTLNAGKNYLVNVSKEGFLFYSDNFSLKDVEADFNKPFELNIPLEPIDIGSIVELKNVFFDVNKWDLKPESKAELDKLAAFLTKNESLKVELGGHTDNTGDKKANLTLSSNRAKAVFDYLVNTAKIDVSRLQFKGYGDTQPKVPNDTPENKAKNRRTEFKVTGK
jgi:outer membrane protein OmpA-like peptidoglycan-associated protein/tetratricopeptide (TPR) repeat protein